MDERACSTGSQEAVALLFKFGILKRSLGNTDITEIPCLPKWSTIKQC